MQRYSDAVLSRNGPVVGASVTVRRNGSLATLYADASGGSVLSNPVTTDSSGEFYFYAPNGTYELTVSIDGYVTETRPDVTLFAPEVASVTEYGAKGDGSTDDTTAIQAAIADANILSFPPGTFVMSATTITKSLRVVGAGRGLTTIKWKANDAESSLFNFSGAGLRIEFENLTIDGNRASQTDSTGYYGAIACGGNGTRLDIRSCRFTKGRINDIRVTGPTTTDHRAFLAIEGCEFDDGLPGTVSRTAAYVQATDNVVCSFINNRASMPSGQTIGRAGFTMQRALGSTGTDFGNYTAIGNHFDWVGRGVGVTDTIGCLDCYSGGQQILVQGNTLRNVMGRAIDVKVDCGDVIISQNTIHKHYGDVPPIVLYDQQATVSAGLRRNCIISHNIIREVSNATSFGIYVYGDDSNSATDFTSVLVAHNIVDNVALRGIYARNVNGLAIEGNVITRTARGIMCEFITGRLEVRNNRISNATNSAIVLANCSSCDLLAVGNVFDTNSTDFGLFSAIRSFDIRNNYSRGATTFLNSAGTTDPSWVIGNDAGNAGDFWSRSGSYGTFTWRDNYCANPLTFSERLLTIASDTITVFADYHWLDTEGAAASDNLVTINGGYAGRRVTLFSSNNARDITIVNASGNILCPSGGLVLSNTADRVTLEYVSGTPDYWVAVGFNDNAT